MNRLGINTQTVFGLPPIDHVNLAADLGCGHISAGLTPVPWKLDRFPDWSLRDNPQLRREMAAAMRDRGVTIGLAEGFVIRPQTEIAACAADLDLLVELGAQRVSTVSMDLDVARSLDQLATLAELAAEREMLLTLEFAPPHCFSNLQTALSAIRHLGMPNAGLVIDAMHFFRSGGTVGELAAVDPQHILYAQLCDAPLVNDSEDYYREASFERKCPGEGELPLRAFLEALPPDIPIGLEVPMLSAVEAEDDMRKPIGRMVEASGRLLDSLRS